MTTDEYIDELSTLSDAIADFKACANFDERCVGSERLNRAWRRLAMMEQPKRLPQDKRDRCERLMNLAAKMLNDWLIEEMAGKPEIEPVLQPPAKAMADTMRFLNAMKAKGCHV